MYPCEERIKAVKLLVEYDLNYRAVIRELGYPSYRALINWHQEFCQTGDLPKKARKREAYTEEQMLKAVNHYLTTGRNISHTVRTLGYPCRPSLRKWIEEIAPEKKKSCSLGRKSIDYSYDPKIDAVISLCSRQKAARKVAENLGVSRSSLYVWKKRYLKDKGDSIMNNSTYKENNLLEVYANLEKDVEELKKEVYKLRMEKDLLEKAAELLKKDEALV